METRRTVRCSSSRVIIAKRSSLARHAAEAEELVNRKENGWAAFT